MREELFSCLFHVLQLHLGILHHTEIGDAAITLPVDSDDRVIAVRADHRRNYYYHYYCKKDENGHHCKRVLAKTPQTVLEEGP